MPAKLKRFLKLFDHSLDGRKAASVMSNDDEEVISCTSSGKSFADVEDKARAHRPSRLANCDLDHAEGCASAKAYQTQSSSTTGSCSPPESPCTPFAQAGSGYQPPSPTVQPPPIGVVIPRQSEDDDQAGDLRCERVLRVPANKHRRNSMQMPGSALSQSQRLRSNSIALGDGDSFARLDSLGTSPLLWEPVSQTDAADVAQDDSDKEDEGLLPGPATVLLNTTGHGGAAAAAAAAFGLDALGKRVTTSRGSVLAGHRLATGQNTASPFARGDGLRNAAHSFTQSSIDSGSNGPASVASGSLASLQRSSLGPAGASTASCGSAISGAGLRSPSLPAASSIWKSKSVTASSSTPADGSSSTSSVLELDSRKHQLLQSSMRRQSMSSPSTPRFAAATSVPDALRRGSLQIARSSLAPSTPAQPQGAGLYRSSSMAPTVEEERTPSSKASTVVLAWDHYKKQMLARNPSLAQATSQGAHVHASKAASSSLRSGAAAPFDRYPTPVASRSTGIAAVVTGNASTAAKAYPNPFLAKAGGVPAVVPCNNTSSKSQSSRYPLVASTSESACETDSRPSTGPSDCYRIACPPGAGERVRKADESPPAPTTPEARPSSSKSSRSEHMNSRRRADSGMRYPMILPYSGIDLVKGVPQLA